MSHYPPPGTRFPDFSAAATLPQSDSDLLGHRDDRRVRHGALRRSQRAAPLVVLGCCTLFLLLSAWTPGFVNRTVVDGVPIVLLLGLLQFPLIWLAVVVYDHAGHRLETGGPDENESQEAPADLPDEVRW
ncbi:DUF485 domain-containing protein [Streptomyces sp. NPDC048409]|uniref:DUF485 domain-containing protein n=1 Tax=Streptomyces sp. NPDC048409 TaxID=3154723 RepID=UPI00342128FF